MDKSKNNLCIGTRVWRINLLPVTVQLLQLRPPNKILPVEVLERNPACQQQIFHK